MTTQNTPGPQQWGSPQNPHNFSQPSQPQWGQPPAPVSAPPSATKRALPWWPTWATIPLLLLTLIGSFLPFLTVKSDTEGMRQAVEDELGQFGGGDFGLDIEEFLFSFKATVNWWGNFTFSSDGIGGLPGNLEDEIAARSDLAASAIMLIIMTSLIIIFYIAALITGIFKLNRIMPIVGLIAAFFQIVAVIVAAVNRAGSEAETGVIATLSAGFWLWVLAAVAAIAVYAFALVNSVTGKTGTSAPTQQSQQPSGFAPPQPNRSGHYGQFSQAGQYGQFNHPSPQAQQLPQQGPPRERPGNGPF